MAKTTKTTVETEVKKLSTEDAQAAEKVMSEHVGLSDLPAILAKKYDTQQPEPVYGDDKIFFEGIVPPGFRTSYGDDVTDVTEGQISEVIKALKTVFKEEDGFRYFFKYVGGSIFTILVPIKYSDENESFFETYRCHASSMILRGGDPVPQIISHAKRVAKYIKYQKNR